MADDPKMHVTIHLHGCCLVCCDTLDTVGTTSIRLIEKRGAFPRFEDDGALAVPDVSFSWAHSSHLN